MLTEQNKGLRRSSEQYKEKTDVLQEKVVQLQELNHSLMTQKLRSEMREQGWGAGMCLIRQIIAQRVKGEVGMCLVVWREAMRMEGAGQGWSDVMRLSVELAETSLKMELLHQEKEEAEALAERLVQSVEGLVGLKEDEIELLKTQVGMAEETSSELDEQTSKLRAELVAYEQTVTQAEQTSSQLRQSIESLRQRCEHVDELEGHVTQLQQQVGSLEGLVETLRSQSQRAEATAESLDQLLHEKQAEHERSRQEALLVVEQVAAARRQLQHCTASISFQRARTQQLHVQASEISSQPAVATTALRHVELIQASAGIAFQPARRKPPAKPAASPSPARSPLYSSFSSPAATPHKSPLGFGSSVPRPVSISAAGATIVPSGGAGRRASLS